MNIINSKKHNMKRIAAILSKPLLSAAASSKFIQSTKVVLINFCALAVVKRIFLVFKWLGMGIGGAAEIVGIIIGFFIWLFGSMVFGVFLWIIEAILLIPYCLWWVATGNFYSWKIVTFFWDTPIFYFFNESERG